MVKYTEKTAPTAGFTLEPTSHVACRDILRAMQPAQQRARYTSAAECAVKLQRYTMHESTPSCTRINVYLNGR